MKTIYLKKTTTLARRINSANFSNITIIKFYPYNGLIYAPFTPISKGYSTKSNSDNLECVTIEKPGKVLTNMEQKCRHMYKNLPYNSVLKRHDSFVTYRISLSDTDVIHVLYDLNSDNNIQDIFNIPGSFDVPGIYCFLSKNKAFYYIGSSRGSPPGGTHAPGRGLGSSVHMKKRFNRHVFNIKDDKVRNHMASPKFYNYVRKYGMDDLSFGCLLATKDYLMLYGGFDLSPEETALLKLLTQWDLLLTEQFFLDTYKPLLNIATYVGTKESIELSEETRKKMSESQLGVVKLISEDKWKVIKAKSRESWEKDSLERRNAVSVLHGKSIRIEDCYNKVIEVFSSQIKAAEYLDVHRHKIKRHLDSGKVLDTKLGLVYIKGGEVSSDKPRSIKIRVYDSNKNLLEVCDSLRAASNKYDISASSIRLYYLDKDRLCKNRYYFKTESEK